MNKIALAALSSAALLALSACGSSDSASQDAQADNVEMPAEETVNAADAGAAPASDAAAAPGADASASPAAAATTAAPAEGAAKAAEDATVAAEKKM